MKYFDSYWGVHHNRQICSRTRIQENLCEATKLLDRARKDINSIAIVHCWTKSTLPNPSTSSSTSSSSLPSSNSLANTADLELDLMNETEEKNLCSQLQSLTVPSSVDMNRCPEIFQQLTLLLNNLFQQFTNDFTVEDVHEWMQE